MKGTIKSHEQKRKFKINTKICSLKIFLLKLLCRLCSGPSALIHQYLEEEKKKVKYQVSHQITVLVICLPHQCSANPPMFNLWKYPLLPLALSIFIQDSEARIMLDLTCNFYCISLLIFPSCYTISQIPSATSVPKFVNKFEQDFEPEFPTSLNFTTNYRCLYTCYKLAFDWKDMSVTSNFASWTLSFPIMDFYL